MGGWEYDDDDLIEELGPEECWAILRAESLGRLAYRLADEVNIVPVNYAVDGRTLLFRTAEGSKLLGALIFPEMAFEVDRYDERQAYSVVAHGRARVLGEDEEHRAEHVPLTSWVATLKYNVVEIAPNRVTGRRFHLDRPV